MYLVYVPCKNQAEAIKISKKLLSEKLVACCNIVPKIKSIYLWKGKTESSNEALLLCKTRKKNLKKLEEAVKKIHSYEIPCIATFKLNSINKDYFSWMKKELVF